MLSMTIIIIIVTCLISVVAFSNQKVLDDLIFWPPAISNRKQYYRFFTCGFIHADFVHLAFNMYSLYIFGEYVEAKFTDLFGRTEGYFICSCISPPCRFACYQRMRKTAITIITGVSVLPAQYQQ